MDVNFKNIFDAMMDAGRDAFAERWDEVKAFAPGEFKKISSQLVEIADNVAKYQLDPNNGYSPATGKLLLKMQRNATESVLVALSALTLIAVQSALDAMFKLLKDTFQGILSGIL